MVVNIHELPDDMNTKHEIIDKSTMKSPERTVKLIEEVDKHHLSREYLMEIVADVLSNKLIQEVLCVCINKCIYVDRYYIYVYIHIYMYICIYICRYIYIY
jgi:hypothetical protein